MPTARPSKTNPPPVAWRQTLDTPVSYTGAVTEMEARVGEIRAAAADDLVWLLQHPPLYTAGSLARPEHLLDPDRFPVFQTGRGGQYTYHGPGQIVGYVMLDLERRGRDVRSYVRDLESWLIATLARFSVRGERRDGRVGIWVDRGPAPGGGRREAKVAAIGVRVRRWVSYHGIALNVEPDLDHFSGIVPCGIAEHGVTSLVDLGITATIDDAAAALRESFTEIFGRETRAEAASQAVGS